jgi:hypothetical protein
MNKQSYKPLVDEAVDAYVVWREACASVWDAYERWARAPISDGPCGFSAYSAALDGEECASPDYADPMARIAAGKGAFGALIPPRLRMRPVRQ